MTTKPTKKLPTEGEKPIDDQGSEDLSNVDLGTVAGGAGADHGEPAGDANDPNAPRDGGLRIRNPGFV